MHNIKEGTFAYHQKLEESPILKKLAEGTLTKEEYVQVQNFFTV